jgi:hypothetical protein
MGTVASLPGDLVFLAINVVYFVDGLSLYARGLSSLGENEQSTDAEESSSSSSPCWQSTFERQEKRATTTDTDWRFPIVGYFR